MNKKIDMLDSVREKILNGQKNSVNNVLKDYREEIVAIHKSGLTWQETADHINTSLRLKRQQQLNARSIAHLVKQWYALDVINQEVVDEIVKDLKPDTNKNTTLTSIETYKSIEEFTADVVKSPDQRFHDKVKIAQAFNSSKGKPKKEMLNTLRDIVLKSMGNV
ncbi:hypothetical protein H0A66_05990 [Alcaligenaceae bacterium]|nr:hypothetical protein [Alcaligenaceae bacterium]